MSLLTRAQKTDYGSHFRAVKEATTEPAAVKWFLITVAVLFMSVFLLLPLICVFYEAFASGWELFKKAVTDRHTLSALKMTFLATGITVPLNVIFGLAAAWCIGKFQFVGKSFLLSLIDIPFAISPVIAGLLFVFIFGTQSAFGQWLQDHNIRVLFAWPGVTIATIFVTFPFVVRELIPVMQSQGTEEEQAARVLGARGWHIFLRITLPNVKWALLYGIILCNARAMGEFGAVVVVAGNSAKTNTLPLHINALYQGYADACAPFAVATILAVMAIVTLIVKSFIEWKISAKENRL
ncbi:MAG: sulfate ABC transporter permease subunit CysW [Thermoguttaceae bacterium]|nr:sulfate ABC transporter permease subunit CysW [Thermoguttaceae bacterium]MBQ3331910.1 sulfate ABC transporter permease subunit CysW [Thermoguttaceae bacterium]MBQ3454119.1 sulfate ABC transporter permease subunit CysW [Thermoguttaceae bacterium]MBQ6618833.1 sulfate ABC transporter permease subunit CysW [Thermoguttaceae bacterium]